MSNTDIEFQKDFYEQFDIEINKNNAEKYFNKRNKLIEKNINIQLDMKVLDIGCGDGIFLYHLSNYFNEKNFSLYGIDLSENRINKAKQIMPNANFVCTQATDIPLEDNFFDIVIINALLHHVDNIDKVINEAERVCSKNGTIIIIEPNRWNPLILILATLKPVERGCFKLSINKLSTDLKQRGFKITKTHLNSFFYPYRKFPPRFLTKSLELMEKLIFNNKLFSTHKIIIAKKK